MTLTILVGDTDPETYARETYPGNRMPKKVSSELDYFLDRNELHGVFRTYTDTLINRVGELIDSGYFQPEMVIIKYEGQEYQFDADGVLDGVGDYSWPYGLFNY